MRAVYTHFFLSVFKLLTWLRHAVQGKVAHWVNLAQTEAALLNAAPQDPSFCQSEKQKFHVYCA